MVLFGGQRISVEYLIRNLVNEIEGNRDYEDTHYNISNLNITDSQDDLVLQCQRAKPGLSGPGSIFIFRERDLKFRGKVGQINVKMQCP